MAQFLAEQMRSIARRLQEIHNTSSQDQMDHQDHKDVMPHDELEGSINPSQLADILGLDDISLFNRALRKMRQGDDLNRQEMTEIAIAFERLLAADSKNTQKAMNMLKRIHAHQDVSATNA
jgi:hypothetical protein